MNTLTNYAKDCIAWKYIYHSTFYVPDSDDSAVESQLADWFNDAEIRGAWGKQENAIDGAMVDDLVFCTGDKLAEARAVAHKAIREWFIADEQNQYAAWMYLRRKSERDAAEHRAEAA